MTADIKAIRQQLEGIIAVLLSLAALAERASRAPLSVRVHVPSILGPAAFTAQDYVYGETGRPVVLPAQEDSFVDDAETLAARFRVLAFALAGIVFRLWAGRRRGDGARASRIAGDAAGVAGAGRPARRSFDTS